jgi:hypothetical protein
MWPTAKIARAIVGRAARQLEHAQVQVRDRVEVQPPQRAGEHHRGDQRRPAARGVDVLCRPGLAGLDEHLAEQDDQEEPEALGEVVRVERLGRVGRRQLAPVALVARAARRLAILVEHRAGLEGDPDHPQEVRERLGHPRRDEEQRADVSSARVIRSCSSTVPAARRAVRHRQHDARDPRG